jgi:hypothetical protein
MNTKQEDAAKRQSGQSLSFHVTWLSIHNKFDTDVAFDEQ